MPSSIYFSLWRCSMENGLDSFARNGVASGNGWRSSVRNGLDYFARNGMASGNGFHFRDLMGFCLWRNPGKHLHGLYHSGWRWSVRNGLDSFARIWVGANTDFSFWDWMSSGSGFWFWLTTGNRPFHPFGPSRVRMHVQNVQHPSFRTRLQQKSLSPPGDFDSMEKIGDGRKWRT